MENFTDSCDNCKFLKQVGNKKVCTSKGYKNVYMCDGKTPIKYLPGSSNSMCFFHELKNQTKDCK